MDFDGLKKFALGAALGAAAAGYYMAHAPAPTVPPQKQESGALHPSPPKVPPSTVKASVEPASPAPPSPPPPPPPPAGFRISDLVERVEHCFPNNIATLAAAATTERSSNSTAPTRTYAQFGKRVRGAAHALVYKLELEVGARVAVLSMNSADYLEAFFSIPFAGLLVVPLNFRLPAAELLAVIQDCDCTAVLADGKFIPLAMELSKLKPNLQVVRMGKPAVSNTTPGSSNDVSVFQLEEYISQEHLLTEARVNAKSNVYGIFYTSGTSGSASKGVMLTHEGLLFNAYALSQAVKLSDQIRYLHCGPMFHIADSTSTFAVTMVGGTHAFVPSFHAEPVLHAIQTHKITHTLMVPSMFPLLLAQVAQRTWDLRSVRYFFYGSSPMMQMVMMDAMKAFPGAKFVQGYGMTETSPIMTFLAPEHHFPGSLRMSSVGQCVPHGLLRICDAAGEEVERGVLGEIYYKGPNVMAGYYNNPELTKRVIVRDGWLRTGDGGRMDENGFVFIADRINQAIKTGEDQVVYSFEVENAIMCCPELRGKVEECAVLGVKEDADSNSAFEQVAVVVVVRNMRAVAEADIAACCERALDAAHKRPKRIIITQDRLPLNASGKVSKTELRERYF